MGADEFDPDEIDPDIDGDGDVDGWDLYLYILDTGQMELSTMSTAFGRLE